MRDDTQPEAREFTMSQYASKDDMIGAMRKRIAELEAELEAVGAGGVSGPLMGIAALSANAGEPRKVFLVATGEEHEGEATYTRYDDKPPPLCDSECLFAAPPTAQAEGRTKTEPLIARSRGEWHEDDGPVVWWSWNGHGWAGESPWCGTPLDSDWPGYHTHWTPAPPAPTSAEGVDHG